MEWRGRVFALGNLRQPSRTRRRANGLELEVRYRLLLWHRPDFLPGSRGQILRRCKERPLPRPVAAGPLELHNISGQLDHRRSHGASQGLSGGHLSSLSYSYHLEIQRNEGVNQLVFRRGYCRNVLPQIWRYGVI